METLQQSGERIKEAKKTLLDTEELSITILDTLHDQRNTILHAKQKLEEADENVSRSRKILNKMSQRIIQNKCIMGFISVILVVCITVLIVLKK